jgi:hypothetical protein
MVVELQCLSVENVDLSERNPDFKPFISVTFLDNDSENRMTAFLKYRKEPGDKIKAGGIYNFAITGLGPVKEDKSSYYLRGRIVDGK